MDIKTLYFHMHESVVCVESTPLTQSCTRMANHAFWRQEKMVSKLHIHRLQFHHHPKKTAEKNTPAKTIEQMAPTVWAHFTKYVHIYLTIFDIHIWINSMRYVRHGNGSVSVGKLWPEAVVIVTWDFMLCIFFVSIDTWQLNSLIAWLR